MPQPLDDELFKQSPALEIALADALVEREPLPEELALDEASRCKYLSKRCLRARSMKAKGVLHNLCLHHRAKAILNQRRLELRKRGRHDHHDDAATTTSSTAERKPRRNAKRRLESCEQPMKKRKTAATRRRMYKPTTVMLPPIDVNASEPSAKMSKLDHALSPRDVYDLEPLETASPCHVEAVEPFQTLSPRDVDDLEPYRTPATLLAEDLEELQGLVAEVTTTFEDGVLVV